jgi:hypothetical protein
MTGMGNLLKAAQRDRYFTQPHQQNLTRPSSLTSPERAICCKQQRFAIATASAPTKLSYNDLTIHP